MAWYELLLFVHIVAAIIWLGAGFLLHVQSHRATKAGDDQALERIALDATQLSTGLFIPASLTVLVMGVLLVIDGPWTFSDLWIVLGLVGYLATFLTGVLVMKPGSERIAGMLEHDGMTRETALEIRRFLTRARVDTLVLYLVVAVMVLKPTGDDVGLLVAMGAILLAGFAYVRMRLRAIDAESTARGPSVPA